MTEIPNVSEKYNGETIQVALGKGDYIAGGAKGMPFLSFENPNKLRPMIAGEVWDDITDYPEIAKRCSPEDAMILLNGLPCGRNWVRT